MKKIIFLIFAMFIVMTEGSLSQESSNKRIYDSIMKQLNWRMNGSDSLYALGKYRNAFYWMREASTLTGKLRNEVLQRQQSNFMLQVELEGRELENKAFRWRNDSILLRLRLASENNKRIELEKDSVSRLKKIRDLVMKNQASDYAMRIKQTQNEQMYQQMKKGKQKRLLINHFYWFVISSLLLLMVFIYIYVHRRERSIINLKKKQIQLNNARKIVMEARDRTETARQEALKANMMKTVFIQNMSHEMRTPLNAIVGFSNLLTDSSMQFDKSQRQEFTSLIAKNSDLLITLIDDILDFSDLSSGKYKIKYSKTTLNDICDVAFTAVKSRASDAVKMSYSVPASAKDNLTLWTDSSRVVQVLINYLTNACKNTESGTIELTYVVRRNTKTDVPETVLFSVTDTGIGVPLDKAETIFKRFEKLDDFKQGNGFGLNICRTIAELLGGRCWLDTSYCGGARFCFEISVLLNCPKKEG